MDKHKNKTKTTRTMKKIKFVSLILEVVSWSMVLAITINQYLNR